MFMALLQQQSDNFRGFVKDIMDSTNTRLDALSRELQDIKTSLQYTQKDVDDIKSDNAKQAERCNATQSDLYRTLLYRIIRRDLGRGRGEDAKRVDSPVKESALVSQTSPTPSSPARITVPSCLLWGRESLPLKVLIDSGADESFIQDELATQLNLPLEPLTTPRNVTALDGRLIAQVKLRTAPVTLIISGNHRTRLTCCVEE
ncbi:hypothetical protein ABVT39_008267 [Epinephelus coioides]